MRNCDPTVITPTSWQPSPQLLDALADLLLGVADQRRAARLAHVPDGGGPDLAIIKEEVGLKEGQE